MTCFPCTHPARERDYDYYSMKWFESLDKLCDACKKVLSAMKPPAERYVLKNKMPLAPPSVTKKVWMPPITVAPKERTEREPNNGELME